MCSSPLASANGASATAAAVSSARFASRSDVSERRDASASANAACSASSSAALAAHRAPRAASAGASAPSSAGLRGANLRKRCANGALECACGGRGAPRGRRVDAHAAHAARSAQRVQLVQPGAQAALNAHGVEIRLRAQKALPQPLRSPARAFSRRCAGSALMTRAAATRTCVMARSCSTDCAGASDSWVSAGCVRRAARCASLPRLAVDVEHGGVVGLRDVRVARLELLRAARTAREARLGRTDSAQHARASKPHAPVAPSSARPKPSRSAARRRPSDAMRSARDLQIVTSDVADATAPRSGTAWQRGACCQPARAELRRHGSARRRFRARNDRRARCGFAAC